MTFLERDIATSAGKPSWCAFHQLSLSRLNHWLPRGQADPEVMQQISITTSRTPCFHRRIRSLTTRQRLTLLLTCSIRSRREWSAWLALCCARGSWWFLGRHEDLHLGKGEGQGAEILQQPASADLCSSRHQMVDVALLMRYIPHSCNWGENRRSAASICDLDHSEGNHGSTFPPVRSRPYGLWAKSCGWWTRRRRRRSRRPFGGGCYISPRLSKKLSKEHQARSYTQAGKEAAMTVIPEDPGTLR